MTEITDENIPEAMSEEYADGKGDKTNGFNTRTSQLTVRNESTGTSALFFPTSNKLYESANGVSIPLSDRE